MVSSKRLSKTAYPALLNTVTQYKLDRLIRRAAASAAVEGFRDGQLPFLDWNDWLGRSMKVILYALQDTTIDRMIYRMKVTALLPDQLVEEVKAHAKGQTLTESLTLALEEWLRLKKIAQLNTQVQEHPLEFSKGFSAARTRKLNRRS